VVVGKEVRWSLYLALKLTPRLEPKDLPPCTLTPDYHQTNPRFAHTMGEDDDLLKRFAKLKSKAFAVPSKLPVDKTPATDVAALDHISISDDEVRQHCSQASISDLHALTCLP
jgi:hypothetical protein